jgi:NAD(P)-dependent dehydrogenase (short-subunit alcohol dehydrogenase family)
MGRLQGKVAIVTGAASGIGRASAILFAKEGASVVAVDRAKEVEDTACTIEAAGGTAIALTADVSSEDAVANVVDTAVKRFGTLDAIYANAGVIGTSKPAFELSASDWQDVIGVNILGVYFAIKHAARVMIPNQRGSIVCTASIAGVRSTGASVPYSASKAAVINMVQVVAHDLAGTNVRINAICPGLIETGMTKFIFDRATQRGTRDRIGQINPLRRAGAPEEIAAAALFLASDEGSYVTGQALAVDGGLTSSIPVYGNIRPR